MTSTNILPRSTPELQGISALRDNGIHQSRQQIDRQPAQPAQPDAAAPRKGGGRRLVAPLPGGGASHAVLAQQELRLHRGWHCRG